MGVSAKQLRDVGMTKKKGRRGKGTQWKGWIDEGEMAKEKADEKADWLGKRTEKNRNR